MLIIQADESVVVLCWSGFILASSVKLPVLNAASALECIARSLLLFKVNLQIWICKTNLYLTHGVLSCVHNENYAQSALASLMITVA